MNWYLVFSAMRIYAIQHRSYALSFPILALGLVPVGVNIVSSFGTKEFSQQEKLSSPDRQYSNAIEVTTWVGFPLNLCNAYDPISTALNDT